MLVQNPKKFRHKECICADVDGICLLQKTLQLNSYLLKHQNLL